ncbi:MAG: hypothetical protein EAZ99_17180 [Alphaproteobacteria bacterium]|nr:lipoprotein [Alphaproteobacteria bacterium]TAD87523.1 MAG: hypothetical protein EAZ99_17180 [Alphaproteobacteria bacterium]
MSPASATQPLAANRRALLLAALAALAGCGRKGDPEPPPGRPSTFPQSYPRSSPPRP